MSDMYRWRAWQWPGLIPMHAIQESVDVLVHEIGALEHGEVRNALNDDELGSGNALVQLAGRCDRRAAIEIADNDQSRGSDLAETARDIELAHGLPERDAHVLWRLE